MKTPFLVVFALLSLATAVVVFDLSRGPDLSGGFLHGQRRAAPVEVPDASRPPIAITLDGVSLRPEPGPPRLIARTVTFDLSTDRFHEIQDALGKWVPLHHAAIVGEEGTPGRGLKVTLLLPPGELDAARLGVGALGTVTHESSAIEDVTAAHRALVARLDASRAEDRRLTDLLASGASGVQDAAGVTRARTTARAEAERLTAEAAALATRAAQVTIVLKISGR